MLNTVPPITLSFATYDEFYEFVRKTGDFVIRLKGEPPIFQTILSALGELKVDTNELNAKVDAKVAELTTTISAEASQVVAELIAIKEKIGAGTVTTADVDAALAKFDALKTAVEAISAPLDADLNPTG